MPLHKEKKYEYDDFKSQSTREDKLFCSVKNCQEIKGPRKPKNVMWSAKAKIRRLCSDKKCQSTRCYKNMSQRRPMYDKKLSICVT